MTAAGISIEMPDTPSRRCGRMLVAAPVRDCGGNNVRELNNPQNLLQNRTNTGGRIVQSVEQGAKSYLKLLKMRLF